MKTESQLRARRRTRETKKTHEELIPVQSSLTSGHQALVENKSTFRDVDGWRVLDCEKGVGSFLVGVLRWRDLEISWNGSDDGGFVGCWIRDSTVDMEFDLVVLCGREERRDLIISRRGEGRT